jgi:hypothetical protein
MQDILFFFCLFVIAILNIIPSFQILQCFSVALQVIYFVLFKICMMEG